MTTTRWAKTGSKWITSTWVSGDQVVYMLIPHEGGDWYAFKQVVGAADPGGYVIAKNTDVEELKTIVDWDMGLPL